MTIKPVLIKKCGENRNEKLFLLFFLGHLFNRGRRDFASMRKGSVEHQRKGRQNHGNKKFIV
jgi:hypothetical protein